ncbi:MAG TPA: amidohydrolase family protein [Candidatus Limnocylindrales bacterium]|nr:amidohydrolase family protein [Candidatus Limnocylindrales bacterium]
MASNVTHQFISADDHIDLRWLPKDLWHQRLPARLRERGPRVIENDKGAFWSWEDQTFSPHGYYTAAQGSGAMWAIERGGVMRPGELRPTTAALRLSDMDRDGAEVSIMYGPTDPMVITDPELRRLCYQAYNDWLSEFCAAQPERLIGVPQLSMEDPLAARDELARLAQRGGLRHVNILASRAHPPVYDDAWEPFWALAEEVGIPVGFHLAVMVKKTRLDDLQRGATNLVVTVAAQYAQEPPGIQLLEPMTGLIFNGVLDRHPRVQIVMAEAGLAWIPNMIQGLDIWYQRSRDGRRLTGERPVILPKLLPSEYFHRQIWISFVDDPLGVKMVGNVLDADKVMFGSDYPHPASTWPNSQSVIAAQMECLPEAIVQKITCDNARALFGIPRQDLRPS